MSTPGDAVRLLLAGYPSRLRRGKLLAVLQAYVDDSQGASGRCPLTLAALIMPGEEWARFSDDWDAALAQEPAIEYFKMVEAHNRRDQFKGFSEAKRNEKLFALAQVIARYRPLSLVCHLSGREHKRLLKPYAPYGLASPYFPLVFVMVCGVARLSHSLGANLPCDFVFDKQDNVSKHVNVFFDYVIGQQPPEWSRYISSFPVFRDDKDVVALQAADLLAWHTRRDLEGNYPPEYEGILNAICTPNLNYAIEVSDDILSKWGEGMKEIPGVPSVATKSQWARVVDDLVAGVGRPN